jgi:hypothetical protein
MPETPIWIACEGSGCPGIPAPWRGGLCAMCGAAVPSREGKILPHERQDILAMIDRGDFDA